MRLSVALATLVTLTAHSGCSQAPPAAMAPAPPKKLHPAPTREKPVITGRLTRAQIAAIPKWDAPVALDLEAAGRLAQVKPGAHVLAIVGTWCTDSRRELPRLYQAIDVTSSVAGSTDTKPLPFTLDVVGVDRDKKSPGLTHDVAYVPTFIVTRDGVEVGRIVESAPNGIEKDLLSLLDGSRSGVITGRRDSPQ